MSNNQDLVMAIQGINTAAARRHEELKELLYKTYLGILESQEQGEGVFTQITLTVGGQPYLMNFAGKKHLFVYTATSATLSASDFGSFSVAAGTWVALEFPETTRISLTGVAGATQLFIFKATDEFIATPIPTSEPITGSISVLNFPNTVNSFLLVGSQSLPVGTTNSGNQGASTGFRGLIVYLNVTVIGTGTIQLAVQGQDTTSGLYYTILLDAFAITANGFYTFIIYPGIAAIASTSGTVPGSGAVRTAVNSVLPGTWRVQLIVATAAVTAAVNVAQLI